MRGHKTLRIWQERALERLSAHKERDFLAEATPGAGKTTFAIAAATESLRTGECARVVIVVPTDYLRKQWIESAAEAGLILATLSKPQPGAVGFVTTYAQVASRVHVFEAYTAKQPTLVILDEIHHAGVTATWGTALLTAFGDATRRLALSGTPFRSDPRSPMPFVNYRSDTDSDLLVSRPDFRYGYGAALADGGVVRRVQFAAITGTATWEEEGTVLDHEISPDTFENELEPIEGDEGSRRRVTPAEMRAWRTILDPKGDWIAAAFAAAHDNLTRTRTHTHDAGGLILAPDQQHARAYAKLMANISGATVPVAVSDDPAAGGVIDKFRDSKAPWLVAVRLVSEGVSIDRLQLLLYAAPVTTELFFRQAVGRVVRSRANTETAAVYLPAVKPLLALVNNFETERDHALSRIPAQGDTTEPETETSNDPEPEETAPTPGGVGNQRAWQPIDSTAGHAIYLNSTPNIRGTLSAEEEGFLGFPGLFDTETETALLTQHHAQKRNIAKPKPVPAPRKKWESATSIRQEIRQAVPQAARTLRMTPDQIFARMQHEHPGPDNASANADLLAWRRQWLQKSAPFSFAS